MDFNIGFTDSTTESISTDQLFDVIIIGAGPAGFNAALYAYRKGLNCIIVSTSTGGQVVDSSGIENYLGFDLIRGSDLAQKFEQHVMSFNIPMLQGVMVEKITPGHPKHVTLSDGRELQAKAIIITTGTKSKLLNIKGEQTFMGRGVSTCAICDGPFFRNKDVIIVGGGNTGVESVIDLSKMVKSIKLVHYKNKLKADKVLVDKLPTLPNVEVIYNYKVVEINGDIRVDSVIIENVETQEQKEIDTDGVFIEIGLLPVSDFVKDLLNITSTGEIIIDTHCQTNVDGIFAAGDVTNVPYKQIIIAAGEGAKAALSASEYINKL